MASCTLDDNESILRRFLGGIDPSIRRRSSEGVCDKGSEIGDVGNGNTDDSGGSRDCSVSTGRSGLVQDVAFGCVSDLIGTD